MAIKDKRSVLPDKKKIRNLVQYRDMSDEDFDKEFEELMLDNMVSSTEEELEERVQENLDEMAEDYDLDDMKANDRLQLRALALAEMQLADLEKATYYIRQNVTQNNVIMIEKLNNTMSKLRSDISKISDDLQLTRRIRKQSQEANVISYIEDIKTRARKFYKERMLYVFCPECKFLLSTIWLLYPDQEHNEIHLECEHCGNKFVQPLSGLYERENKNLEDVVIP